MVCREVVGHQRCAGWLQGLSFLVVCREGRGIGAVVDALWGECGIGAVVDVVGDWRFLSKGFCDFCWWGGYTEGTYLGTFWAVRLSDPHMVGCINMAGEEPVGCWRFFLLPS